MRSGGRFCCRREHYLHRNGQQVAIVELGKSVDNFFIDSRAQRFRNGVEQRMVQRANVLLIFPEVFR